MLYAQLRSAECFSRRVLANTEGKPMEPASPEFKNAARPHLLICVPLPGFLILSQAENQISY